MSSLGRERLGFLESDSMKLHDLGGGVLHRDFDVGEFHEVNPDSRYKFLCDLSSISCQNEFNIFHLNCQGIGSSYQFLNELCLQSTPHVLALTETWLKNHSSSLLEIGNYKLYIKNREMHQHGGLAIYVRNDFEVKVRDDIRVNREMVFESMVLELQCLNFKCFMIVVYRPPSYNIDEFSSLLEEQLDKLPISTRPCFICGDFNLDLRTVNSNLRAREFLNTMLGYGLQPSINICTRVSHDSATLIDNVYLNTGYSSASVIVNDVSDHFGLLVSIPSLLNRPRSERSEVPKTCFPVINVPKLKNELGGKNCDFLYSNDMDVNDKFTLWYSMIKDTVVACSQVRKKRKYFDSPKKPWVTKSILVSLARRQQLYKKSALSNSISDVNIYKAYSNKLNSILRKAKLNYLSDRFKNAEGNPRKTWNVINSVIKPNKPEIVSSLVDGENIRQTTERMCEHFSSVGGRLASSVEQHASDGDFTQFLPESSDVSMYLRPVTEKELCDVVKGMRNSASGSDFISTKVFKSIFPVISQQILYLINASFKCGIYPECLKSARVIPLFKGGDRKNVNHYRPISLLSVISRLVEKLINSRVSEFLENISFFHSNQFGFRKGMSTEQAVLFLTTFVHDALDQGFKVASIFLDIVKAFDSVDHEILIMKLENCGIRGNALKLFETFLRGRTQCVEISNVRSGERMVDYGVPQGSVLGPLLFLVYINDLRFSVLDLLDSAHSNCRVIIPSFADDTHFTAAAKTESDLIEIMRRGMLGIDKWMRVNKLLLNHSKSGFIIYGRSSNFYPWVLDLQMENYVIKRTNTIRYLGVIVDECLSFKNHVSFISSKIARNVGMMRKLKNIFQDSVLRLIYFSLVHPYLVYCVSIWSSTFSVHLQQLRVIQNMALRVLSGDNRRTSVRSQYVQLNIIPVSGLGKFYHGLFMFKYFSNLVPKCFLNLFISGDDVHNYPTRHARDIRTPQVTSTRSLFSIRHVGPVVWNNLPVSLKSSANLCEFRRDLKTLCLHRYEFV